MHDERDEAVVYGYCWYYVLFSMSRRPVGYPHGNEIADLLLMASAIRSLAVVRTAVQMRASV